MKMLKLSRLFILTFIPLCLACSDDDKDENSEMNFPDPYDYTQEEKDEEITTIRNFITDQNLGEFNETESGLFYQIEQSGGGLYPYEDDTLIAHFDTYLVDPYEFIGQSYREDNPYGQVLNMRYLLEGVREGFLLVNEGSIITMIVPSFLAYGKAGTINLPYKAILMYRFELNYVLRQPDPSLKQIIEFSEKHSNEGYFELKK